MKDTIRMVKPTTKGAVIKSCTKVDSRVVVRLPGAYLRLKSK